MSIDTTRIAPGDLAALLGSRLCHDLISPLGAIGNGVELLEMSPDFPGLTKCPEMQLIAESVAAARSRIQAFRMAFGQAQGDQRIPRAELARLLDGAAAQGRLRIELDGEGDFARPEIRMVMLALMCLETAMPWGGRIVVLRCTPGWRLIAESDRMRPDPALWSWLGPDEAGPARHPSPAEVQFALLAEAARAAGRRLSWDMDEQGAEIAF
ncbi:histidine phosphotransferase family protein [Paracoccus spongiarum]|uniref:Histidine phosphotransferase family protein n=1 Tax=Paracoccus spongiarum TaxID=3064387 RepID=A0ABT9J9B2_9RHOB|nr:histidine phosphotransferase family protein [Paracoccus sp. 2205BS29-5]MDP5306414.1 histidine phosphotransferase family protein [Paracoccus sp. 2205BS29-5]